MRRYAQEAAVSVEKSKAEIETMLNRYGATAFMSGTNQTEAIYPYPAHSGEHLHDYLSNATGTGAF